MLSCVPQRRAVISTLAMMMLLAVGAIAVYRVAAPTPEAAPGRAPRSVGTPAASNSPTIGRPTARPTPTEPTPAEPTPAGPESAPDQSLASNSAYSIDLSAQSVRCSLRVRGPKPPVADAALAPYLRSIARCLTKAFAKPLAVEGFTLETPKIKTYRKTLETPCGKFGQRDAPAYYCSSTQTIYWPTSSDDGSEAYTFARLGYVGLLAHEYGHHLQATTGMLGEYGERYAESSSKKKRDQLSRRLELQAQCFEGVFLSVADRELIVTGDDRYQLRSWHSYTGDEDPPTSRRPDHGSSAAQIRWLERGLDTADFSRCNTWKAKAKSVR